MENETVLNDMQSLPPTSKNVVKYQYEKVRPPTIFPRVLDDTPVEFHIEGRNDSMVDLKNIQLAVKFKIRKKNYAGNVQDLVAADHVVPYCGFLYLMWSDVQVELQHRPFYKAGGYYDLLTYIQILYSIPNDTKDTQLLNAFWFRDVPGGHSLIVEDEQAAPGEFYRFRKVQTSAAVDLLGKLFLDCFNVNRPLPDGMSTTIKFYPNEPKKCILWNDAQLRPAIQIEDMYLIVPRIVPRLALLKQPAKLPWVNSIVHRFMFPAGFRNFGPRTIMITESLPRKCVIVILTETQLNGQFDTSRLAFSHQDVDKILLTLNGEHIPMYDGYEPDFLNTNYSEVYDSLFHTLGSSTTIDVKRNQFPDGFVVFPFELTQKNISSEFYPPKRAGSLELTIHFRIAARSNLAILAILEEERVLSIDKNREWKDISI